MPLPPRQHRQFCSLDSRDSDELSLNTFPCRVVERKKLNTDQKGTYTTSVQLITFSVFCFSIVLQCIAYCADMVI